MKWRHFGIGEDGCAKMRPMEAIAADCDSRFAVGSSAAAGVPG